MVQNNENGHQGDGAQPAMTREQFAAYIEKRLTLHDDIVLLGRDGMDLQLRVADDDRSIDLGVFYAAYARDPTQLDVVMQNFVAVAHGIVPDRSASDFAELADRIYPMLKPISLLAEVRERRLPMLAYSEFLAQLIITYVVYEGRSVAFINEEHLERWGLGVQELHAKALENLRERTQKQVDYSALGEDEQRLFIFNSGDGYDATRLLLTDVIADWANQLPGNIVLGIPNRDFLIAFSDANPTILNSIAQQIQADAARLAYGLTEQLFTFADSEIKEYQWE
jgi:uncharacterized protein YtpQ (UPF0354 family)